MGGFERRVAVRFYSPCTGRGWKAPRLAPVLDTLQQAGLLSCFYGLKATFRESEPAFNSVRLRTPLLAHQIVAHMPFQEEAGIHPRRIGIAVFEALMARRLDHDRSRVVFSQMLPGKTVRRAASLGKLPMVECDMAHPLEVATILAREREEFSFGNAGMPADRRVAAEIAAELRAAHRVIVFSRFAYDSFIKQGFASSSLRLIFPGSVSPEAQRCSFTGPLRFISTAYHGYRKNTHRLLLAWKKAGIHNAELWIVGRLSQDMVAFVRGNAPFQGVKFQEKVDFNDYLHGRNIGVLCSLCEGSARSVIELARHGIASIVSKETGCDFIEPMVSGLVVEDPRSIDQLAGKLGKAAAQERLWRKWGEAARQGVLNEGRNSYASRLCEELRASL